MKERQQIHNRKMEHKESEPTSQSQDRELVRIEELAGHVMDSFG
jgi:hypothetical protein